MEPGMRNAAAALETCRGWSSGSAGPGSGSGGRREPAQGPCVLLFQAPAGFPLEDPASPGWESPLLIVQTQFLCDGAVRTKNCVWTSVAEVSPPPAGLQDGSRGTGRSTDLPRARGTAGNRSRPRPGGRGQDFRDTKEAPAAAPLCSARPRVLGFNASNTGGIITGTGSPDRAAPGRDGGAEPRAPALCRGRWGRRPAWRAGTSALRLHPGLSFLFLFIYLFYHCGLIPFNLLRPPAPGHSLVLLPQPRWPRARRGRSGRAVPPPGREAAPPLGHRSGPRARPPPPGRARAAPGAEQPPRNGGRSKARSNREAL
nr:uncharacterized protein LOC116809047 [Taeniopygia guttata]